MTTSAATRVIPRPSERRPSTGAQSPRPRSTRTRNGVADRLRGLLDAVGWLFGIGAGLCFGALGLLGRADTSLGLLCVPVAMVIVKLALQRWVGHRIDKTLTSMMFAGYGLRLLASVPRLLGGADSPVYQREGVRIAESLRGLHIHVDTGRSIPGTGAVRYFSGIVNVATGSTYIATFLVFLTLAFVGQVFFLLGVRSSLRPAQFSILSALVMFSPTLAFWPSSIGKESLSLLGIGLTVFGASKLYDRSWAGFLPVLSGFFAVGMVRPHVAMVLLSGLLVGLFARRAHTRGRMAIHLLVLVVVVVGLMLMAGASAELFNLERLDGLSDVSAALDFAQERTSQDEAQFVAARVSSVIDYPWAAATVLFRPFLWEAPNALAMVSGLESTALLVLVLRAVPGLMVNGRQLIQRGQLLFGVAFTSVFILVFSAIGNFGIMSRQRSQVLPFVFLLVAIGLGTAKHQTSRHGQRSTGQ